MRATQYMTTYIIALTDKNPAVWEAIGAKWPNHSHIISDTLAMVSAEGVSTPEKIKEDVGIAVGEGGQTGVVVRFDKESVSGVLSTTAVDWLREAMQ